ncbi:MAG: ribosomal RNA small subunit methyltransferase H [Gemmatales bacterium]|nr:MAG: ribosomal RNA small subunit methyltransferase H [Gemmatales bacterium]
MMTEPNGSSGRHVPVMPAEVLAYLSVQPDQTYVDATVGIGGHARKLAERLGSGGRLIALDRDPEMLALARANLAEFGERVVFVQATFDRIRLVLDDQGIEKVAGVLADLGICSDQLGEAERGFSFSESGPLDMRMDRSIGESAQQLLARLNERELADLFWRFGEERFSRRIARRIVEQRRQAPLTTTEQLAELVRRCVPRSKKNPIDPATRVFQALRIAVNDELGNLERFLNVLPDCVKSGGRAVIISFHSLEDRLVKHAFRERENWRVLTKKPVTPAEDEVRQNPRSRSAKLRAAERV